MVNISLNSINQYVSVRERQRVFCMCSINPSPNILIMMRMQTFYFNRREQVPCTAGHPCLLILRTRLNTLDTPVLIVV
jgi:hypothetical protein